MNVSKLASLIAFQEGKKHQASIGDIREILAVLCDMAFRDPVLLIHLWMAGRKRAAKGKR